MPSISAARRISAFAGRRIITVTPLRGRTPAKKGESAAKANLLHMPQSGGAAR